eukprot:scaffold17002_cov39-Phaeocystis_antarctica.AAC.2
MRPTVPCLKASSGHSSRSATAAKLVVVASMLSMRRAHVGMRWRVGGDERWPPQLEHEARGVGWPAAVAAVVHASYGGEQLRHHRVVPRQQHQSLAAAAVGAREPLHDLAQQRVHRQARGAQPAQQPVEFGAVGLVACAEEAAGERGRHAAILVGARQPHLVARVRVQHVCHIRHGKLPHLAAEEGLQLAPRLGVVVPRGKLRLRELGRPGARPTAQLLAAAVAPDL